MTVLLIAAMELRAINQVEAQKLELPFGDTVYKAPSVEIPKDKAGNIFRFDLPPGGTPAMPGIPKRGGVFVLPGHDPTKEKSWCRTVCFKDKSGKVSCLVVCGGAEQLR